MVRSASPLIIATSLLLTLAGCSTTQQQAARLQLNSARLRASEQPLRATARSAVVRVVAAKAIDAGSRAAVVITLHNDGAVPVSDLALLVAAKLEGGRSLYLNDQPGLAYFQTHTPAIAPHQSLTWVLTLGRRLPTGSVPFATVGAVTSGAATTSGSLPPLEVVPRARRGFGVTLTVRNLSGVPQYQLPVYAIARRAARLVAAGQATIGYLGTRSTVRLRVPLVGDPSKAALSLEAPPTIFK